jgi:hypothetical protein
MSFLSIFNPSPKPSPAASPVADPPAFIGPVASPTASDARCDSEGFYQHLGECWNDSIQMIFLFSDGFKEIVQPALLDPNFGSKVESIINDENNKHLFLFNSDLVGLNTTNLGAVNNPFANNSSKAALASKVRERKNAIIDYFKVLKKRFMRHYNNESIRRESCDLKSDKEHSVFQRMSEISRAAGKDGIAAAALGHLETRGINRSHINVEELKKKKAENKYSPGGSIDDKQYLFNLYKLVFFDNYEFKYTVFNLQYENLGIFVIPLTLSEISKDLIQNSKAVYIGSHSIENEEKVRGHATAFYTCGGSKIYYDDNTGIYSFPWKEFLLKAVELYEKDKTTQLICGNNTQSSNKLEIQESTYYPIIRTGVINYNEEYNNATNKISYTYYTFIEDSLLLESKDGHFEYNGVLINLPDKSLRKITELVFMTINNDQSVNTQRFNYTARHGRFNWEYLVKIIHSKDSKQIIEWLHKYIQENQLNKNEVYKNRLKLAIMTVLRNIKPIDLELNNKLFEIAEKELGIDELKQIQKELKDYQLLNSNLEQLQKEVFPNIEEVKRNLNEYINSDTYTEEGFIRKLQTFLKKENLELQIEVLKVASSKLNPIQIDELKRNIRYAPNPEILRRFELLKEDDNPNVDEVKQLLLDYSKSEYFNRYFFLEMYNVFVQKEKDELTKVVKQIFENVKRAKQKVGGYRKRKTRYQKRLIKRKTQKKCRSRR